VTGTITRYEVLSVCETLHTPLSDAALDDCMERAAAEDRERGEVDFASFAAWYNSERFNEKLAELRQDKAAARDDDVGSGQLFG
jgi:hypothetical protein